MPKVLGIDFAPLSTPMERRLQTGAVIFAGFVFFGVSFLIYVQLLRYIFTPYSALFLPYLLWMIYDRNTCDQGGRLNRSFRKWKVWQYYGNYFPVKLHKTVDLDPNKNYVIAYHPHGIFAIGSFINFGTEATGFSQIFPGITCRLVTLVVNYWLPITREVYLCSGTCSANSRSIDYILSKMGKGNAAVIVVGGAAEALDAVPNTMKLTLRNRKGFVRLAIKNGASLVPCISFGENELFKQKSLPENSVVKTVQGRFSRLLTVSPPLFYGRGIFQYTFGFLPFRRPIHTVVGAPLDVKKIPNPTDEYVDEVHQKYAESVRKLFDEYKTLYADNPDAELLIK